MEENRLAIAWWQSRSSRWPVMHSPDAALAYATVDFSLPGQEVE